MPPTDDAGRLVVHADPSLAERLARLAGRHMVFFAGLPGTGKSLLVHQLAHLAMRAGRAVHLLQWDVARPVFEAVPAGQRYPQVNGVTHPMIRKAAGLWVRYALTAWTEREARADELLIGETPFVGNRFVELAQHHDDRAEALLTDAACRFVVTVPSREVRAFLEAERERRAARPLHAREREDAPPSVLRDLWRNLAQVAREMGIAEAGGGAEPYSPEIYRKVYETVLRHRHVEAIELDVILPTTALSVYDFDVAPADLMPSEADADRFIREAERRYPDPAALDQQIAHWWHI